jgi:predicted acyltransferase
MVAMKPVTAPAPPELSRVESSRLASVDAFRGATVAAMLLVNNPGSWGSVWWPLAHAEWHGWTPADLIFPFFLFVVGITTELSRKDPLGILRRGALIVLAGLALNAFPFTAERFATLRFSGVLQRIGLVYIAAAFIARWCGTSGSSGSSEFLGVPRSSIADRSWRYEGGILAAALVILFAYWAILSLGPLEPPEATVAARIDRALLGEAHIWKQSRTWDPEGPLSTIPAVATALLGVAATAWVRARKVKWLTIAGFLAAAAGLAWGLLLPINKNLWTSSYVLFTAGVGSLVLAGFILAIEGRRQRAWAKPLVIYGMNPLVAFLGSGLMARLLGMIRIDGSPLQVILYRTLFRDYFPPHLASFLFAFSFVLVWLAILWALYRRGIVLKV